MLSIIIPTLNEEDYLSLLLNSIKAQDFSDYEIIVADAGSTDKTLAIAQKYGCAVVPGGLPGPARNHGAKIAKGDLLFFLDADTTLPESFLTKALQEFSERKLGIASFFLRFKEPKHITISLDVFYNKMAVVLEQTLPHSAVGILVKKSLFEKVKGYDELLKLSEDHDLSRRAQKQGAFGIIRSTEIMVSDRRFVKDGWLKTCAKYFLCELHTIFIGPVKSDIFNYKFNHYKEP